MTNILYPGQHRRKTERHRNEFVSVHSNVRVHFPGKFHHVMLRFLIHRRYRERKREKRVDIGSIFHSFEFALREHQTIPLKRIPLYIFQNISIESGEFVVLFRFYQIFLCRNHFTACHRSNEFLRKFHAENTDVIQAQSTQTANYIIEFISEQKELWPQ